MDILFFLKPIVDMLYAYQFLDIILLVLVLFFLVNKRIDKFVFLDFIVVLLLGLFALSFAQDTNGLNTFIKIASAFLMYFLGRMYYKSWYKYVYQLQKGFIIILIITLFSYITGIGYIQWGSVNTFTGFYFFKTDLAAAMTQCAIMLCIMPKLKRIDYLLLITCCYLAFISNARMYYFIILILLGLIFIYQRYPYKRIEINTKFFVIIIVCIVGLLIGLNILGRYIDDFLLFKIDNASDLMNDSNTQGRNQIWEKIYDHFQNQNLVTRLIGIDLVSDSIYGEHNSHNVYLKILYSTGYIGISLFLIFIFYSLYYINKVKSARLFYISCSLFGIFLLGGISYITLESTQISWLPMFFIGVCVSETIHPYEKKDIILIKIYSSLTISNKLWLKACFNKEKVIKGLIYKYSKMQKHKSSNTL